MLGVDHDKNILLSTPFPTIPMLGTNCWCNVIMFYVGNKRCCIVLYCIVHFVLFYLIGCQREPSSLDVHILLFLRISASLILYFFQLV